MAVSAGALLQRCSAFHAASARRGAAPRPRLLVLCSSSKPAGKGDKGDKKGKPPGAKPISSQDALMQSLGELSKTEGRVSDRTNMVLGGEESIEKWKELDQKVNEYPCQRQFKCVGVSEDGFPESMVQVVEGVLGTTVHPEAVATRPSSQGKYISVQIGPVIVRDPDQVLAIFAGMKQDSRVKWVM